MNQIKLKGVLRNIEYSHTINGTDYQKAELVVKRPDGDDDVLSLRFKQYSNKPTQHNSFFKVEKYLSRDKNGGF